MGSNITWSLLVSFLAVPAFPAQQEVTQPLRTPSKPDPSVLKWRWFEKHKNVTGKYPTTYQIGGVYRLKQDVVVEYGGTGSRVTQYWVRITHREGVDEVKERLRDPEAAKQREIQALRQVGLVNPRLSSGTDLFVRQIRNRRETQSILSAGTLMRFQQVWLERSFEMGVTVDAYAEVLDGPMQGKWLGIYFLSDHDDHCCDVKAEFLEYVGQ